MPIVKAEAVTLDMRISSVEILDKLNAPCRVIGIQNSGDRVSFRLVPDYLPSDSILSFRFDTKKEETLIQL